MGREMYIVWCCSFTRRINLKRDKDLKELLENAAHWNPSNLDITKVQDWIDEHETV